MNEELQKIYERLQAILDICEGLQKQVNLLGEMQQIDSNRIDILKNQVDENRH